MVEFSYVVFKLRKYMHWYLVTLQGEDLDFAYDSISAFASRPDNQEAVFAAEEGLKDIRYQLLPHSVHIYLWRIS